MNVYSFDWSGANGHGNWIQGIRCYGGTAGGAPEAKRAPGVPGHIISDWTRNHVSQFLIGLAEEARRTRSVVLVGMDFAFGFPFLNHGNVYHDGNVSRNELWQNIWELSGGPNLMAQDYVDAYPNSFFQGHLGEAYLENNHALLRLTENVAVGVNPASVYKLVGSNQVGKSSITGIAVLHGLLNHCSQNRIPLAIWPLVQVDADGKQAEIPDNAITNGWQPPEEGALVVVETYPSLHYPQAGVARNTWETPATWDAIQAHFQTNPAIVLPGTGDQADALAAWYALAGNRDAVGNPLGLGRLMIPTGALVGAVHGNPGVVQKEGWIFGM
jgi:hypothetical protein